jgi:hypothetical protein
MAFMAGLAKASGMLQDYLYQALELNPDGSVNLVCHEGKFQAFDLESAIVTGQALLEVIPTADACNELRVLDHSRHLLWSGPIGAEAF